MLHYDRRTMHGYTYCKPTQQSQNSHFGKTAEASFPYIRLGGVPWCRRASIISRTACFNSLPDAFVGKGVCCANTTLGTMNEDRLCCLQASLTNAGDSLASLPVLSCCVCVSTAPLSSLHATSLSKLSSALTCMCLHCSPTTIAAPPHTSLWCWDIARTTIHTNILHTTTTHSRDSRQLISRTVADCAPARPACHGEGPLQLQQQHQAPAHDAASGHATDEGICLLDESLCKAPEWLPASTCQRPAPNSNMWVDQKGLLGLAVCWH